MQNLNLSQQARLKALEYQLKQMSREQLETYCMDLGTQFLLYQNSVAEMAREGWFGSENQSRSQAGHSGF